jgi:hypothetical protein
LSLLLTEIEKDVPEGGFAALRMWGQTGDRPTAWIAGADPVYLEPRLDHLCLHAVREQDLPSSDFRALVDHLQRTLAGESDFGFARLGGCAYLTAQQAIATALQPAYVIDGKSPDDYLPVGDGAAGHRRLSSEIEMALHDHAVNLARLAKGLQPVNGLWIWGGGHAPEQVTDVMPPLFSEEPLTAGHWMSKTAVAEHWPGSIDACIEKSQAGFVAVTPSSDADDELLESCLYELRIALQARKVSRLRLIFRDGVYADVRRSQSVRIWRRGNSLIDGVAERSQ